MPASDCLIELLNSMLLTSAVADVKLLLAQLSNQPFNLLNLKILF